MRRLSWARAAVAAGAAVLLTAGCLSSGDNSGSGGNKNTGKSIEIMMAFTGPQATNFEKSVDPYAKSQGITIKWSPTSDFNSLINTRVRGNQLPDIALFPQPGIMRDIVKTGKLTDLSSVLDLDSLKSAFVSGEIDAGTANGKVYAVPVSMNVKSIIFYPKQAFSAAGYSAPQSIPDLLALTDKIRTSGKTPWCLGIESGAATGWPATDWIEELVLKYGGIDQYNDWVNHKMPFESPLVNQAAGTFAKIAFTDGNGAGGWKSIASNNFNTAANPMFANPPGCFMYKQGNFVAQAGGFPASVISNIDSTVGVFPFPPAKAGGDNPVEGGGDLAGLFSGNNDAAKTIVKYMTSQGFGAEAAKGGTFLAPRKDFPLENYPNQITKDIAKIAYTSTVIAFDGSDQMPGAVGSGTFWRDMTSWISGQTTQADALKAIDTSWPKS
jgi:alpha-glucoside transport system substrate-binding protein